MSDHERDILAERLAADWDIVGYSTIMMAAGAMTHSILLRKGDLIDCINITVNSGKELGRLHYAFSPAPEKKKGWLG